MKRRKGKLGGLPAHLKRIGGKIPIIGQKPKGILISMGMYRYPNPLTVTALMAMQAHWAALGTGISILTRLPAGSDLVKMRNQTMADALDFPEGEIEAVLMLDDDMTFPIGLGMTAEGGEGKGFNPLERLWSRDKDIIGALCTSRARPIALNIAQESSSGGLPIRYGAEAAEYKTKPFPVDYMGFGMVLVRRRAILKMVEAYGLPPRFFHNEILWRDVAGAEDEIRALVAGGDPEKVLDRMDWIIAKAERLGEDWSFCRKARRAGCEVWCDPSFEVLHHGDYGYGRLDFMAEQELRKDYEKKEASALR